jgi:hypothetical protein
VSDARLTPNQNNMLKEFGIEPPYDDPRAIVEALKKAVMHETLAGLCREESRAALEKLGEEPGMWRRFTADQPPDYEPALVAAAIFDALTEHGVAVWQMLGVGAVEEIVRAYANHTAESAAEKAKWYEAELRAAWDEVGELKQTCEDLAPGNCFLDMVKVLAATAATSPAKNYASVRWDWDEDLLAALPVHRVEVVFYRDGGKTQAELVAELEARVAELEAQLEAALDYDDVPDAE